MTPHFYFINSAELAPTCTSLVLWIYGMVWIYNDSQARGESPALWVILTFFFSAIVLIIYGIMKSAKTGLIIGVVMLLIGLFQGTVGGAAMLAAINGAHVTTTAPATSP